VKPQKRRVGGVSKREEGGEDPRRSVEQRSLGRGEEESGHVEGLGENASSPAASVVAMLGVNEG